MYRSLHMEILEGIRALEWAREISKVPEGSFTIAFYPYSSSKRTASNKLRVIEGCKTRKALPNDIFSIGSENFFLFTDSEGNPKTCYRILIRYMGFPNDGFKLHKINWI